MYTRLTQFYLVILREAGSHEIARERPRISAREFPCEEDDFVFSSSLITSVFNRLDLPLVVVFRFLLSYTGLVTLARVW